MSHDAYIAHVAEKPELAIEVTHPDDPDCPGHDINLILIDRSRELGECLCIHPMMSIIDFAGMVCAWCDQKVPAHATRPDLKEIRTAAVRAVLGDGSGPCRES